MDPFALNLNHLVHFHAVADKGSLKLAGERLSVAPSTLSEQMRALEEALGRELFDRSAGRLHLNDDGRRVRRRTAKILTALEELLRDLDLEPSVTRPVIAVGISGAVSHALAASFFLPLFDRDDLHVRTEQGEFDALYRKLLAHELDLVFSEEVPTAPESKGLQVRRLGQPPLIAVATPELAERLAGEWPRRLEGAPFLNFRETSFYRWHVDDFFAAHVITVESVGEVDDVGLLREVVKVGTCVAFLPEPAARSEGAALVELGRIPAATHGVSALYHAGDPARAVARAIESLLAGRDSVSPS